jgi:nicotinamidase-related amidase
VIRDLEEGDGDEYQVVKDLVVHETDIKIEKYHNNSFWKTSLEDDLKEKGSDTVVLCGNALEFCVTATYFGALERGFKVLLLQQGLFALEQKSLDILYTTRPLISYTALSTLFNK